LGAVWDEVLLDKGEIVEVTREHGYVWSWEGDDVQLPLVTLLGTPPLFQGVNERFW